MEKIYASLYDITNENLHKAGKSLAMSRETFLFLHSSKPGIFDVSLCGDCSNESFLQMAYQGMLGRMPDPGAVKAWMAKSELPKDSFRRQLIAKIEASEEFAKRETRIINNIYNKELLSDSKKVWETALKLRKGKQKILILTQKVYRRLPQKVQLWMKKAVGR